MIRFLIVGISLLALPSCGADGTPMPKTQQTHKCGNSVCPPIAAALVAANCNHLKAEVKKDAARRAKLRTLR